MKVLCLVPYPTEAPSNRLRIEQYLPWLAAQGIRVQVRPFMGSSLYRILYEPGRHLRKIALTAAGVARRLTDLWRASRADVVVVHREALPFGTAVLERAIAGLAPALVFDFDDAIYLDNVSRANAWTQHFRGAKKTDAILASSAHVIAGNETLAAYARQRHARVSVIPTPVDAQRFRPRAEPGDSGKVVLGWIGSQTTGRYLSLLQEPLAELMRRYPHLEVRVVGSGDVPLHLPGLRTAAWHLNRELEELHRFDIGLMPMPNDAWTQGKCGFKALLYMSVGIPVVASAVGVNAEIVRDGVSGFVVDGLRQWTDRLSRLIEDRSLRLRMGAAGRAIVEQRYALTVQAPRFLQVLEDAAEHPRRVSMAAQPHSDITVSESSPVGVSN